MKITLNTNHLAAYHFKDAQTAIKYINRLADECGAVKTMKMPTAFDVVIADNNFIVVSIAAMFLCEPLPFPDLEGETIQ